MTRLLALDPASQVCGYAVIDVGAEPVIVDAGLLRSSARDPIQRLVVLDADLVELIEEHQPHHAAVEVPDGTVHRRIRGSAAGAGLSVYGLGVGYLLKTCHHHLGLDCVTTVSQAEWTRSIPKGRRAMAIAARFPGLAWDRDAGHDAADAVGVGLWWAMRRSDFSDFSPKGVDAG